MDSEQSKKKNWFKRHSILSALIVLFLLGLIGVAAGGGNSANTSHETQTKTSSNSTNTKVNVLPTLKNISTVNPIANWKTYVDSVSDYSIKYPSNYYVYNIQRFGRNELNMVDFNISSNNLSTGDDVTAFSILATDKSTFSDFDHSPQACKDENNCSFAKIINNNKIPFGCYTVGNSTDQVWLELSNSYICRYTNVNTDLLIWIRMGKVDKETIDNIVNSFQFVSSPKSTSEIAQEVSKYGVAANTLNYQAVIQMNIIAKDLTTIQNTKYSQLNTAVPKIKTDLNAAQSTFQQIYDELNTINVPYDMEAAHAHYQKAIYVEIQATKTILQGVNDNNEAEIISAQDIIHKADDEVNRASAQVDNYKTYSGN